MSNQCSNLSNYRSFSFCTPLLTPLKPYATALRPYFPFQHNLISIGRRSRRRSSSFLPLTPAAQSSSDVVLIATTEHRDGSLVFRFGDASEVVESDDVEEVIESQTEQESSVVKVLDGDQDRQVIIKTGDRGYDNVEGRLIEVADEIRNEDIGSDIVESETNAIRDFGDDHAESSEILSDSFEKEVLLSQSDAKMNDYLKVAESTLDESKFSAQLNGQETSDPTIYLLDEGPNMEKSADREGTRLKGSGDRTVDPSVSVELEGPQVSQFEVTGDLDKVETEDTRKSDTEDIVPSALPATMHISDIKLTDVANEDVEEELKEGTLIDELPPSNPSDVRLTGGAKDVVEELQDMNIHEATIIDEMTSSDQLVVEQPTLDEVNQLQSGNVKDQTMEEELQQVNTKNREENDVAYVIPVSRIEEAEIVVVGEASQPQSTPLELKPTVTMGHNLDNGSLQVDNEIMDPSVEAIQVSDNEVMDITQPYAEDESQMVESKDTSEGDTQDLLPPATMNVSDVDMDERLQDMDISKGTFIDEMPASGPLGSEKTLEGLITIGMDAKYVDTDERLQDMNISEGIFIDDKPASDQSGVEPTLEVSTTKDMDVKDVYTDERLQDMKISEGTFIDDKLTSDPLGVEPTLEVSTINCMDVKDVDMDERLQDMNISEGTFIDEMSISDLLGAELTLEVSTTKDMDVVDMNERLQDMNISEGTFIDEMPTSDPLGVEPTLEFSTTEGLGVKDLAVEAELKLVSNDNMYESSNADVMPAEPIVEVEVYEPHLTPVELKVTTYFSDIKVQDATTQNLDDEILQVIGEDAVDSYIEDVEDSSLQLESEPLKDEGVNPNMLEQCAESDAVESSILLKEGADDPLPEAERTEGVVSNSELAEASEVTTLLLAAEAEVERKEIYLTDDFLLSGAALLEHPFKALAGGDDAYFVGGSKWLGVANGVSQWSFEGTGPGVYAQKLMRTCEEIVLDTSSGPLINPVDLLCRGVKETNMSGSSNVLIANFSGQALHVANIGDTGFLIIRHGAVFKKSSPLLHEFHFALQVNDSDDPLQLVEEHLIELEVGDIVVSATDGLFDNLYEREITMIVSKSLQAGMKPQEIANILATRAQEVGKSVLVRSPFSDAAQAAGYTGFAGGKPDNVAVIVSLVENRSNLLAL